MPATEKNDAGFSVLLSQKAEFINGLLAAALEEQADIEPLLKKALSYTLLAPGKRVRSALALWCCELVAGQCNRDAEAAAVAIEMVHTYSLVHDDLPAMDDDDYRRGQPTCHKAFDEATAVLTGDALLTLAFEVLAKRVVDSGAAVKMISELAEAAGGAGMIGGQMADLDAEGKTGTKRELAYIHTNKTAKMFRCAAAVGAIAGRAGREQLEALKLYGMRIGLGFQVADDILDVCASSEQLGKTAGKDARAGKMTYPAVVGMEQSRESAERLCTEAIDALSDFGDGAAVLRQLARALLARTR